MIACIDLMEDGPAVSRRVGSGRRALVVVGEDLSTATDPGEWPERMDPADLLVARDRSSVRYVRREVAEAVRTGLPGVRVRLVPRDLLAGRSRSRLRMCRALSLRSRRFRSSGPSRRSAGRRVIAAILVLSCAASIVVAERSTAASRQTIETAARIEARRYEVLAGLAADPPGVVGSGSDDRASIDRTVHAGSSRAATSGLIEAVIVRLQPLETIRHMRIEGESFVLRVQTPHRDLTERLSTIESVLVTGETLMRTDRGFVVTMTARVGAAP